MIRDYRDMCRDCVHFAPWPERVERAREAFGTVPMDYPAHACMASPSAAYAVRPEDSPANCTGAAAFCARFRRGKRSHYVKEVFG